MKNISALGRLTEGGIYEVGRMKNGRMNPEFQYAIDTWSQIVKTRGGQLDFIQALRNRETDAINYFMYRAGGMINKNYKRSTPAFSRGEYAENYENAFQGFVNEVYLTFLGKKSPVDTFDENKVSQSVDLIVALVNWVGLYLNKTAGFMRNDLSNAGLTKVGKNSVFVDSVDFDNDQRSEEGLKASFSRDGVNIVSAHDSGSTSLVSRLDPTADSVIADDEAKDLLKRWIRFCRDPSFQGKASVPGDAKAPAWLILKDMLLGEKLSTEEYLRKFGGGSGVSQSSIHEKKNMVKAKLMAKFTNEEMKTLFLMYGQEKIISYLRPRVGSAVAA